MTQKSTRPTPELDSVTAHFSALSGVKTRLNDMLVDAIAENSEALVMLLDHEGRIIFFNQACERASGLRFPEVVGEFPWDTLLLPEDADDFRANAFETLVRNPQALSGKYNNYWLGKSGRRTFIAWTNSVIRDGEGNMEYIVSVGVDITERHRVEQELTGNEERLNEAQRLAMIGSWHLDLVEGKLAWSDEIYRMFEVDKEVFGASYEAFLNAIHPDDRDLVNKAYSDSLVTREPYEIVHRLKMADGTIKFVREKCRSFFDESGKPIRSAGTVQDITELHLVEQKVRDSEARLQKVIDAVNDGIWDWNPTTHESYLSPRWKEIVGYQDHELPNIDSSFFDLIHSDDKEKVSDALTRHLEYGEPFAVEMRMRHKNGSYRWVLSRGVMSRDEEGAPYRMLGSIKDITESMEMLKELKRSERELTLQKDLLEVRVRSRTKQLRDAQRIARLGHWSWNIQNNAVSWSREACHLLGYEPYTVAPSIEKFEGRLHPDDREKVRKFHQGVLAGAGRTSIDYRIVWEDGSVRWMHGEVEANRDDDGKAVLLTGTLQDITDRKETQEELVRALDEAERANQAKSDFLSRMSHELRTPLNAILGFGQLLEMDQGMSTSQSDGVREIVHAGQHLLEMINEILDLSRIDAGKIELSIEEVDLLPVINECMNMVGPLAVTKQVKMHLLAGKQPRRKVMADRMRLRQVVINLLSNAVKYNHEAGEVFLDCTESGDGGIRLSVRDTGYGIANESINRLFRPFERLESPYQGIEGSGIGLALVKQLAEAMGGSVGVDSHVGLGSTFWVDLPAVPAKPNHKHSVLYIEDNPANLRLMQTICDATTDLKLTCATTGEIGIAMAKANQPDLILMDINLPGMDGYRALRQLRSEATTRHIPVIAITANAMDGERERGLAEGFDEYVTKPLDASSFDQRIIEFLDRKRVKSRPEFRKV